MDTIMEEGEVYSSYLNLDRMVKETRIGCVDGENPCFLSPL